MPPQSPTLLSYRDAPAPRPDTLKQHLAGPTTSPIDPPGPDTMPPDTRVPPTPSDTTACLVNAHTGGYLNYGPHSVHPIPAQVARNVFTRQEVARLAGHAPAKGGAVADGHARLLLIIDGVVVDATHFAEVHPGGAEAMWEWRGKDVSHIIRGHYGRPGVALTERELQRSAERAPESRPHRHSDMAIALISNLAIGILDEVVDASTPGPGPWEDGRTLECSSSAMTVSLSSASPSSAALPSPGPATVAAGPRTARQPHKEATTSATAAQPAADLRSRALFQTPPEKAVHSIDLTQPIVQQIWNLRLNREAYLRLTHTPAVLPTGQSARFFANPILEVLSRTPWWAVLVWVPVIVTFFVLGARMQQPSTGPGLGGLPWGTMMGWFLFGVLNWSLLEYSIHRFLFHLDDLVPDHRVALLLHFVLHGVHHFLPMDPLRLVMPPAMALILMTPIFFGYRMFFPDRILFLAFAGGLTGFLLYDLTHYYLHHGVPSTAQVALRSRAKSGASVAQRLADRLWNRPMAVLKRHHLRHHYEDYQKAFGITSKLWDGVFSTELPPDPAFERRPAIPSQ
ncbi:hypothetical protein H696_01555 [Fonticula alba]|uniref:Cytochrome b5 heme-binding domain-containing protein n=1 Tax=Fonticula alba TaxID=691883 RepID=A0A058ZF94_FONAL|nr:hypothetical protein, variant [Fonticula alba]XP_009493731.1 hypothetical protein H696_01555 [Fonticula alba]KCV72152.1 hypothetical protein H696_01555 [Fonticula alba]KCV72153.1 hypothetical protein, variant [Fonticula alba]|eukprot:XP_009493730.1 hypothetical protein, variant [Fonticula alba]